MPGGAILRGATRKTPQMSESFFSVELSDHGVAIPSTTVAKVSDEWTIRVSLFAKAGA